MMMQQASLQHMDKDALRKLPLSDQQKIGIKAAQKMAEQMPKLACIDTHALIKTPKGYCPGIPQEVLSILQPNAIVMIECAPEHIFERRKRDTSRKRDQETIEEILRHQELSRSFSLTCSALTGALYSTIYNNSTVQEAGHKLAQLFHS
jgi:adenylate kinase